MKKTDCFNIMEKTYKTQIPRLSDINKANRLKRKADRQRLYKTLQTHTGQVSKYYDSPAWKNARMAYLMEHPLCELSMADHKVVEATQVHHIIKWADQVSEEMKWTLMLDPENLMSVTNHVHQCIHYNREELTEEQLLLLQEKKEKISEKYLSKGLPIVVADDSNKK